MGHPIVWIDFIDTIEVGGNPGQGQGNFSSLRIRLHVLLRYPDDTAYVSVTLPIGLRNTDI